MAASWEDAARVMWEKQVEDARVAVRRREQQIAARQKQFDREILSLRNALEAEQRYLDALEHGEK